MLFAYLTQSQRRDLMEGVEIWLWTSQVVISLIYHAFVWPYPSLDEKREKGNDVPSLTG